MSLFKPRINNKRAAAANQYALLLGLIVVIAIAAIANLGSNVSRLFIGVSNRLTNSGSQVSGNTPPPVATAITCKTLLAAGNTTSGTYTIDPDGAGGFAPFQAECDMTNNGGGWTQLVKSSPSNVHPAWSAGTAYNAIGSASYISIGWWQMANFTDFRMQDTANPGIFFGGTINGCWSNETMSAQIAKSSFTCTPGAIAGMTNSTLSFNVAQTYNGCAVSASISRMFNIWDAGVSGSYVGINNGYKTNNTINCSSQCVIYSPTCLAGAYNGTTTGYGVEIWVR